MKTKIIGIVAIVMLIGIVLSGCIITDYTGYIIVKVTSSVDTSIEVHAQTQSVTKTLPSLGGTVATQLTVTVRADDGLEKSKQCESIVVSALGNTGTTAKETVKVCRDKTSEVSLTLG